MALCLALGSGCASSRHRLASALLADGNPSAHARDLEAHYLLQCPDVVTIQVEGRHTEHQPQTIGPNGAVVLGDGRLIRMAGRSVPDVEREVSRRLRVPVESVDIQVVQHRSQNLYLFGEVNEGYQVVPYRGPETILDLLQRVGGAAPGAALGDIRVVRAHIADGKPPEVFSIDLAGILLRRDLSTNIRLEPFDRIHIGQTNQARVACCLPPWLRRLGKP